jgi:hypothetical protein
LEVAKAGEELLPFVGRLYTKAEFRVLKEVNPHLKKYALRAEANVYQDGDVVHGNVASSSIALQVKRTLATYIGSGQICLGPGTYRSGATL